MDYLFVVGGLLALVFGGEFLVRGAITIAERFNISPMIISVTLVGFGTSTPELVTSVQAAINDAPGIAVGNVIGSNIANILLILGLAALMTPIAVSAASFKRDGSVLVAATILCVLVVLYGAFGRLIGFGFVALLAIYLATTLYSATPVADAGDASLREKPHMGMAVVMMVSGLIVTIFGAKYLVEGAISVASGLGVSEAIIGLTVVAVGTSLPELATSVIAARKGQVDVAFGNVLGSNIFNILGILGVTAVVKPLVVPLEIITLDIWVMALATLVLCWVAISGWTISRREGLLLLAGYLCYIGYLVLTASAV